MQQIYKLLFTFDEINRVNLLAIHVDSGIDGERRL